MAVTSTQIQQLYVAYFARPADPVGLNFYIESAAASTAAGTSDATILDSISTTFAASAEYTANFTGMSNAQIVNQVYQNLFSHAADTSGLLYWAGKLTSGALTVSNIVRAISTSAVGANNVDGVAFGSKVTAAESFTASLTTADQIIGYSGTAAGVLAKAYITSVNSAATLATAILPATLASTVTSVVAAGNYVAGSTFTLTTGVDSSTSFTGGVGADTFNGALGGSGNNIQTLNSSDVLNGGGGTDTLIATVNGGTVTPRLSLIETMSVTDVTADATLDLTNSSGYTSIENTGSTFVLTTSNINSTSGVALKYANSGAGATFNYTAAAVAGTADSATLTLSNVTGGAISMTAGVETLNIVSADAANTVVITGSASPNIVVSGTQNLALGQLAAATTNLNASSATGTFSATLGAAVNATVSGSQGADTITVSAVTGNLSVDTGAGNDNVIATAAITLTDTINGGAGTADVLTINQAQLATLAAATPTTYNITNIERITSVDAFDGNQVLTNVAAGVDTLTLNLTGASLMTGGDDTITGGAGSLTVNLGGTFAAQTLGVLAGAMVVVAGGTIGTTDSLTLNSRAVATLGINTFGGQAITSTGYENVTIDSNSATGGAALTFGNLAINTDSALSTPTSLTLTGANQIQNLALNAISTNSTGLFTINASGMTAQNVGTRTLLITSTTSGTAGTQSITGSGGDDSITIGAFAATINGGAGQDTLAGNTGSDSISGGDGNDTIGTGNGNNTVLGGAGLDTITAGTGNDSLSGGDGNDSFVMAANLTANDTIDGGAGTNTLSMVASANASTVFANVSNIQTVSLTGATAVSLAAPLASTVTTYDLSEAAVNNLTFATGFTGATTVLLTNGAVTNGTNQDVITNNANIALTVSGLDTAFNTVQVVGGTGTDALVMTAASGTASLVNTSGIETITMAVATATPAATSTITNAVVATGKTLTVNASAMTNASANFSFSGAATQLGAVNVTGALNSVNTINLANFAGANTVTGGAGIDTITAGTGINSLSGGAASDAYVFGTTLLNTDTVIDSAGTADTLDATINGLTATTGALSISGVEQLNLQTATAASTINAAGIVGATRINVSDAQNVTFTNLAAGTNLGLGTLATGGQTASSVYTGTLTFGLATSSGSSDAVTVTLANVADGGVNATLVAAAGIETVTLATSTAALSAATLNIAGVVAPTIAVTGGTTAKVVALGTLNAATTALNAPAFLGQMTVTGSATATAFTVAGAEAHNITGGAGNDTFTISAVGTAVQTVAGGTGTDTLNMTLNATTFSMASVSAVETVNLTLASNSAHSPGANVAGFNDAALTTISVTGGNSLSTFTAGTAIATGAAFKSFSAAGVSGVVDVTVANASLALGNTVTGGSGTSDVLRVANGGSTTVTAGTVSGFESMVITTSGGDTGTQSFTNTSGLSSVTLAGTGTFAMTGMSAGVAVNVGVAGGTALTDGKGVSATLTTNTGATDAMTFNLANASAATTGITLTAPGIETVTLSQSTTTANTNFAVALVDTNTTNAVNVVMNGGIAGQTITFLSGGLETNVATVQANSTYASNLVMASGSRTGTAAMTITGGTGNDTIIMKSASDVLDGATNGSATNTVNDTLSIVQNAVLGGFLVDLTSTTDQVTTHNGSANAAIQKGFENVDLSGITGNFGADITARAAGSNIVGTLNADQITGGAGVDTITGGAGADAMTGGAGSDSYRFIDESQLFTGNALVDTFTEASAGGTDSLVMVTSGSSFLIQVGDDFGGLGANIEQITAEATTQILSVILKADADTDAAALRTIDLSGDTDTTGTNVVTLSAVDGAYTVTGSAGVDQITGSVGVDNITGAGGTDAITIAAAADTGVGTFAAATATSTTTLDKIFLGDLGDNDTISLAALLQTATTYDAFTVISNGGNLVGTVAVGGGANAGTVSLITGIYSATANTFTSTTEGATTNAVMISTSATDAGTTATDSIIIVGAAGLLSNAFAIANGIITA